MYFLSSNPAGIATVYDRRLERIYISIELRVQNAQEAETSTLGVWTLISPTSHSPPVKIGSSRNEANRGRSLRYRSIESSRENSNHNSSILSRACNYIKKSYDLRFEHCTNESETRSVFSRRSNIATSTISFFFSKSPPACLPAPFLSACLLL